MQSVWELDQVSLSLALITVPNCLLTTLEIRSQKVPKSNKVGKVTLLVTKCMWGSVCLYVNRFDGFTYYYN